MSTDTTEAVRKEIRGFFRQMNSMFVVFVMGVFLFLISVVIVVYFQGPLNTSYATFLYFGAPVSSVALILMAGRLSSGRFKAAANAAKLFEKMDAYRSGTVLRMILLDGAAFIQILAYVFTAEKLYLLLCLVVVTLFMMYKPGMERFIRDMNLNEVERKVIRDHSF